MAKLPEYGGWRSKMQNSDPLRLAKLLLPEEDHQRLLRSYRRLFWFQISPVPAFLAAELAVLIFVPSAYGNVKLAVLLLIPVFFCVILWPVWLVISQFTVGKLWHKYSKWYRRKGSADELYNLLHIRNIRGNINRQGGHPQ